MQAKSIEIINEKALSDLSDIIHSIKDDNIVIHIENNNSRFAISKDILLNMIKPIQDIKMLSFIEAAKYIKTGTKGLKLILASGKIQYQLVNEEIFIASNELDKYLNHVKEGNKLMQFLADENQRLGLI